MKNAILLGILLLGIVAPLAAQGHLTHFPVNSGYVGEDINLEARVEGILTRVLYIRIYYKNPEESSYRHQEMIPDVNRWVGIIPGRDVAGERLQYFLTAILDDQSLLTYPEQNPYNDPEEITLLPPRARPRTMEPFAIFVPFEAQPSPVTEEEAALLILSPEPGEQLAAEEVIFAVSLLGDENAVDSNSVRIYMDGRDVTSDAEITSFMATFTPKRISPGRHRFRLEAKDVIGTPLTPVEAGLTVLGEDEEQITSRFQAHLFSDMRQEDVNQVRESFAMGGVDFDGEYGALQYDGRFFLTSLEDRHYQPRNRFHLTAGTKHFGLTGGDAYPRYNDLILWGKRVRGLSGYLKLGFFNLEAIFGETYRPVDGSAVQRPALDILSGDTLKTVSGGDSTRLSIRRYGTFKQKLMGIRPSFGSGRHFQLGLTLVRIRDDTSSITYGTGPKDNLVFGPDLNIRFARGRVQLRASGAFSLITNDISSGALSADSLKSIFDEDVEVPIDPADYEQYIIINESTVPLDPSKLTSMAYDVGLKINAWHNLLRVGYKSIGSEYLSLANSWIRKDIRGFYFSDRVRLFRNKVYLTFGLENYKDNYSKRNNNPSVDLKTVNYSISFYPGQGWPYMNVSLRDYRRDNGISDVELDSLAYSGTVDTLDRREDQLHRDLSIQIGHDFELFTLQHAISLSLISAEKTDNFAGRRLPGTLSQENSTRIRMFTLRTSYSRALRTTLNYASNENLAAGGDSDFKYRMMGLGAEYGFWNNTFTAFFDYRRTTASGHTLTEEIIDYSRSHLRLGALYQIAPRHTLTFDANVITFSSKGTQATSYDDQILRLRYEKYF